MGLRLLWLSAAPMWAPSGYGVQTRLTVQALMKLPEVDFIAVAAFSGLKDGVIKYAGIDHFPAWTAITDDTIIAKHMQTVRADVCVSLMDIWALGKGFSRQSKFPWIPIIPIDGAPLATGNLHQVVNAWKAIAMSQFGENVMRAAGVNSTYIPHVVDTKVFRPMSNKRELKKKMGLPEDCFLIGMVAANKGKSPVTRKGFSEAIHAFSLFHKQHPEARMYIHSPMYLDVESADLPAMAEIHGVNFDLIRTIEPYAFQVGINDETMASIYSAFDVYFSPSAGEGFNVPLIEAQACGIPVVANRATAQTENVGAGWLVEPLAPITVATNTNWFLANPAGTTCPECGHHVKGLIDGLEEAYEELKDEKTRNTLSLKARKFATKFDIDQVVPKYWRPFLQKVLEDLGKKPPSLWTPKKPLKVMSPQTPAVRLVR